MWLKCWFKRFISAPSKPPLIIGKVLNATALQVEFYPGKAAHRNGFITKYTLYYKVVNRDPVFTTDVEYMDGPIRLSDKTGLRTILKNLEVYTLYELKATMHTIKGEGNYSEIMYLRTGQASKLIQLSFICHTLICIVG